MNVEHSRYLRFWGISYIKQTNNLLVKLISNTQLFPHRTDFLGVGFS